MRGTHTKPRGYMRFFFLGALFVFCLRHDSTHTLTPRAVTTLSPTAYETSRGTSGGQPVALTSSANPFASTITGGFGKGGQSNHEKA
jgi:hypothetical protein